MESCGCNTKQSGPATGDPADCCQPGCCGPRRRFISKQERKEQLERYRDALTKELQGVDEALAEL